jgi:sec-independent protein translocase protein TatC
VAVGFLVCWAYAPQIFGLMQDPLARFLPPGDKLAYTRLTAPFFLYMKVAFFSGLFVAAPVILLQVWMFIAPGLYKRERMMAAPFIIFGSLFFIAGGYFGYRFLLPATCGFFVETGKQFKQMVTVDDYFSFASTIILACGLVFETPIIIFFLARLGIVTPAFLMQKFKYAVVLAFIISAIVTPTPDMMTQTMLALPMIGLYLLGVAVAYLFGKKVT